LNQGALAGFDSKVTEQAADLVLAVAVIVAPPAEGVCLTIEVGDRGSPLR
jgi:hypothetical protein